MGRELWKGVCFGRRPSHTNRHRTECAAAWTDSVCNCLSVCEWMRLVIPPLAPRSCACATRNLRLGARQSSLAGARHKVPPAFADDPRQLFDLLHTQCVLTPHAGEFARLFPDIADRLAAPASQGPAFSKVDATREAARRAGCSVLFKGADTVIADPTGLCSVHAAAYARRGAF